MARAFPLHCTFNQESFLLTNPSSQSSPEFPFILKHRPYRFSSSHGRRLQPRRRPIWVTNVAEEDSPMAISQGEAPIEDEEVHSIGVKAALSLLKFYKREISPLLPKSCRFVPTCSEYSMIAYKKYGVTKGTVLTAWRLCRCHPLGGSGFDPPRWFDESSPPNQ